MRKRIPACVFVFCAAALAQTLTVEKLAEFIHSSTHEMKGKQSDKETAAFIARMKLTERLDDATIEEFQNEGAGPLTVKPTDTFPAASAVSGVFICTELL